MTAQQVWEQRAWLARVRRDGPQGWICGAGFLIDDRHLVTCAHVVAAAGAMEPGQRVYIDFPLLDDAGCWAVVLDDGWAPEAGTRGDTAVLQLARPLLGARPIPARTVSSLRGQPFLAYGFPRAYEDGVEATGRIGGPVGREWQQLEVDSGLTVQPGFSGGALWSIDLQAVIGLIVTRDAGGQGRVAFAVPLPVLAARSDIVTAALPTALDLDPARDTHWLPRARGGISAASPDRWLFQGRRQVLAELVEWLIGDDPPAQRVVTGTPGSGKSAVLAQLVVTADRRQRHEVPDLDLNARWVPPPDAVDVAFHARDQTVQDFTTHLARVLDLTGVNGPEQLRLALQARPTLHLVVDAVDEASQPRDLARLLTDLSRDGTRILVGCRDHMLDELDDPEPLQIDRPPFLQRRDVQDYVTGLLLEQPSAKDTATLHDPLVPEDIVTAAEANFLVAQLVAQSIQLGGGLARPFPRRVHQAFERLLDALPDPSQARALLLPLAYSHGDGLPARHLWLTAAASLGRPQTQADLDDLLASPAAAFLTTATNSEDGRRYRLFHQALAEALTRRRNGTADAHRLWSAWHDHLSNSGWQHASEYLRTHAADHAAAAGQLMPLVDDIDFLAVADIPRLLPLLPRATGREVPPMVRVLQRAGLRAAKLPAQRRLGLFAVTAADQNLDALCRRLSAQTSPFRVRWAHTLGVPHRELTGHTRSVNAVALGQAGDRDVIVSGSADNTLRIWDAVSGQPLSEPLVGHTRPVTAVALGRMGSRDAIVSAGLDGTVRIWDAASGSTLGGATIGHVGPIMAVALGCAEGEDLVVSGGIDGRVMTWRIAGGQPMRQPSSRHSAPVTSVTIGRVDGRDLIVSTGLDGRVRVADAGTLSPLAVLAIDETHGANAVALGQVGDRGIIVSGCSDGTVRLWDGKTHRPLHVLTGHSQRVRAVAVGDFDTGSVIVSGSDDGTVRLWDATTGEPVGAPLTGHTAPVTAVACRRVGDQDLIVSGSDDGTVRLWQPTDNALRGQAPTRRDGHVTALAIDRSSGQDRILCARRDGTMRFWDATTGEPVSGPLVGHTGPVSALALGRASGRDVAVSGGIDGTVRLWAADSGRQLAEPLNDDTGSVNAVAIGSVGDRSVIVYGGADGTLPVWDAGYILSGPPGYRPNTAVGGAEIRLTVWDASDAEADQEPLSAHGGQVRAVALGRAGDRDVIVSGGDDGTVQVWTLLTATCLLRSMATPDRSPQ